ncbi:hypothetical protein LCGC14_2745140 [marine sediment metagenome]|uniref:Uncharacterized protein n=1 Tax=marine sediment metagenome TaxID=412755 RepID=A0A0F8ZQG3_9ZZZZ
MTWVMSLITPKALPHGCLHALDNSQTHSEIPQCLTRLVTRVIFRPSCLAFQKLSLSSATSANSAATPGKALRPSRNNARAASAIPGVGTSQDHSIILRTAAK